MAMTDGQQREAGEQFAPEAARPEGEETAKPARRSVGDDPRRQCQTCRWFDGPDGDGNGACRRHAPVAIGMLNHEYTYEETCWPGVTVADWCGDHVPRKGAVEDILRREGAEVAPASPYAK